MCIISLVLLVADITSDLMCIDVPRHKLTIWWVEATHLFKGSAMKIHV